MCIERAEKTFIFVPENLNNNKNYYYQWMDNRCQVLLIGQKTELDILCILHIHTYISSDLIPPITTLSGRYNVICNLHTLGVTERAPASSFKCEGRDSIPWESDYVTLAPFSLLVMSVPEFLYDFEQLMKPCYASVLQVKSCDDHDGLRS